MGGTPKEQEEFREALKSLDPVFGPTQEEFVRAMINRLGGYASGEMTEAPYPMTKGEIKLAYALARVLNLDLKSR